MFHLNGCFGTNIKQLTPCPMADMAIGLCGHSSKLRRRGRLTSVSMRSRQSAEMILGASPPTLPCSLDVPYLMLTMYARPVLGCRVRSACVPVISFVVRIGKDKLGIGRSRSSPEPRQKVECCLFVTLRQLILTSQHIGGVTTTTTKSIFK